MPFSKTSWQVTKETGSEKDSLYHFRFDKEKKLTDIFFKNPKLSEIEKNQQAINKP